MREYEFIIDEALSKGLSPLRRTPANSTWLYSCLGFRCGKGELESYEEKSNPIDLSMIYSWPFPQVIAGESFNFLIIRDDVSSDSDKIYMFSNDGETVTLIATLDTITFGQGGLMEVADFGEYAIMTNGVAIIAGSTGSWTTTYNTPLIPLMNTMCNFKGQIVGGGVKSSWHDCDEKFYCWSKIGYADFTPDEYNTAGYRRDPYGGEVLHCRRVGDNVIGYSTEGITLIHPVSEPHPTFGFKELDDVGILNQGAEAGDLDTRVYLGEDYQLRRITNKGIEVLDYRYYMSQLSGEDVIITYDKNGKDFYIGNSTKTFLLSSQGLTEIPQHPSGVWRRDGSTYCVPETVDNFSPIISTQSTNFGYAGQKTIFVMESDIENARDVEFGVDTTFNNKDYSSSDFTPVNDEGAGTIIIAGNAFRFKLKASQLESDMTIGYIKVRFKMTDLRSIRGVYAPPPRGQ